MRIELSPQQKQLQAQFRSFANTRIAPFADDFDKNQATPDELIKRLSKEGFLGAALPKDFGGGGMDAITYGILTEEIARGCSSVRSLLTVHNMVSQSILKWGSKEQRGSLIPKLASGEMIAAFALTEPNVGSDAGSIETTATSAEDSFILNGRKKWITYGQIADVFLVFAKYEEKVSAFLVEKSTPGLVVEPISDMIGMKASMLASLSFNDCKIPKENIVAKPGFGFSYVGSLALDHGRYSVAWGCVGVIQACLEASLKYANERKQFGVYLKEHQLIQQMLTNMVANLKAARLLCFQAGYFRDIGDPKAIMETSIAKYFASTKATSSASDAVQIHGANGCSSSYPVQRYLRDAKIMEIIEGSTQIQQINIAKYGYQEFLT